jgi:hypothetical protein
VYAAKVPEQYAEMAIRQNSMATGLTPNIIRSVAGIADAVASMTARQCFA